MQCDSEIIYIQEMLFVVCTPCSLCGRYQTFCLYFLSLHQMTPLHLAAESGHIKVIKNLVARRADINIQDDNGVIICDRTYQYC